MEFEWSVTLVHFDGKQQLRAKRVVEYAATVDVAVGMALASIEDPNACEQIFVKKGPAISRMEAEPDLPMGDTLPSTL